MEKGHKRKLNRLTFFPHPICLKWMQLMKAKTEKSSHQFIVCGTFINSNWTNTNDESDVWPCLCNSVLFNASSRCLHVFGCLSTCKCSRETVIPVEMRESFLAKTKSSISNRAPSNRTVNIDEFLANKLHARRYFGYFTWKQKCMSNKRHRNWTFLNITFANECLLALEDTPASRHFHDSLQGK